MPTSNCGTVEVFDPFTADDVSVSCPRPPNQVQVGEPFTVSWTFTNANDATAVVEWELNVGSTVVESGTAVVNQSASESTEVVIDSVSGASEAFDVGVSILSATRQ